MIDNGSELTNVIVTSFESLNESNNVRGQRYIIMGKLSTKARHPTPFMASDKCVTGRTTFGLGQLGAFECSGSF